MYNQQTNLVSISTQCENFIAAPQHIASVQYHILYSTFMMIADISSFVILSQYHVYFEEYMKRSYLKLFFSLKYFVVVYCYSCLLPTGLQCI